MPATHPDTKTRIWNLQEHAEIARLWRDLEIARALCEHSSSPDNDRLLMQAWNAYADHIGLPEADRPGPVTSTTSFDSALLTTS
jgi:hypothetical protein